MSYKRILITRHGGSEVLQLFEDELPEPQTGEVRVRILASGVAFTDVLIREGLYPGIPKPPFSPGYEIIGIVDKLGLGVSALELGQRVVALTIVGGYSEYLCLPATELIPVPKEVDTLEAVSLVLQYVTAYQILHRIAKVKSGVRILIHGAAGGVGTALLELGKLAGLEMYGTASKSKHELVSSLGAIPIDYKNEDFVQRIYSLTGDGVDIVCDAIGGSHLLDSYKTLRNQGRLINYGFSSALSGKRNRIFKLGANFILLLLLQLLPDGKKALFYNIAGFKKQHPDWFREDLTKLLDLLVHKQIKPIIADRLPLSEAARAHELLDCSAISGQLVLLCSNDGG
ncbi:MAG: zinc-binding dehydrogenase [Chlorogloeopsis fritschii C42_A2020_084]|uniref:medium chain dehydrogenase/reductase family protein n=1 Tax=Chlorogloeopsis fritschii TaxID=1124 RepID=UPI0019F6BE27|nr:medium chain dehydrogenase/reductase family protein [Chlorogloeopsis fritschii]MBF2007366.1 zinc-binding dehydrogenase [Chlorogloeopsis fritschii C42_A2020_084]